MLNPIIESNVQLLGASDNSITVQRLLIKCIKYFKESKTDLNNIKLKMIDDDAIFNELIKMGTNTDYLYDLLDEHQFKKAKRLFIKSFAFTFQPRFELMQQHYKQFEKLYTALANQMAA